MKRALVAALTFVVAPLCVAVLGHGIDYNNYLRLSGGTLSGPLTVHGLTLVSDPDTSDNTPGLGFITNPAAGILLNSTGGPMLVGASGSTPGLRSGSDSLFFYDISHALYPGTDDGISLGRSDDIRFNHLYMSRGIQGAKQKSLTDGAAAVAVVRIPVSAAGYQAGEVLWDAQSTDATDLRVLSGRTRFAAVNKAGTLTCGINVVGTDLLASSNGNILACTWTNVVNTTNCDLSVTCTDDTAGSQSIDIKMRVDMTTVSAITFP